MSERTQPQPSAEQREQALAEIEASLLQQGGIGATDREAILRHFEAALRHPDAPGDDAQVGPSRSTWVETMQLLRAHQVIDANEQDDLIRQFDHATSSLQVDAVQRAARLAQRADAQGESDARTWLDGNAGSTAGASPTNVIPPHVALSLRQRR